jgi:hypothetical protein
MIERLSIRPPRRSALLTTLSGGNQQKVALGKWMLRDLAVLVMDDPTRGVDVGAGHIPDNIPTNTLGGQAVALALQFLGVPYVWGGATPSGFDCSGLTMYVYGELGIRLGHYTGFQYYEGRHVPRDQLQPGDLVFFRANAAGVPQHEGMYIGSGSFVQAPHTGDVVRVSSLYDTRYALSYVGAVRPYAAPGAVAALPAWTTSPR